jgi:alpha-tubulin suppressor-like RCC1 family protein
VGLTVWAVSAATTLAVATPASAVPAGAPAAAQAVASTAGGYVALSPARLLDTRVSGQTVDGKFAKTGAIKGGSFKSVTVTGRGGVPSSGVGAVVLNVTAVTPTSGGFVTVFPAGETRPNASNLNVLKGDVSPNLVTVKVGAGGAVSIYVSKGASDVLADVAGYFPAGSSYTPLSPGRLMDTRSTGVTVDGQARRTGAVSAGTVRNLQVTGRYGIPATGVGAVVLNVTGVAPTRGTYATVWPTGAARPNASNLNLNKGEVKPNLVIAKLGSGGRVSFAVGSGSMDMLADVAGWIPSASSYTPLTPARLLDTRSTGLTVDGKGQRTGAVGAGGVIDVVVTGRAGIPASGAAAVVLNVTGVAPTAGTFVTAYPSGETRPNASNLNLTKGEVRPNLVIAKVGSNGKVRLYNKGGSINLIADVAGWFATPAPAALAVTTASLPGGVVARTYPSAQLAASGGTAPYTWALRSTSAVPVATGLTVSATGVVSGTPQLDGARYLPVRVTDSKGATADKDLAVTVTFQATVITTTSLPSATCGTAYSAQLAATGSFFPNNWFLKSGSSLPTGLTLSASGKISGTPTANSSTPFTVQLVDAKGGVKEKTFTITVTGCTTPVTITSSSPLPAGTVGTAYNQGLAASGGTAPYTWSISSGTLPAGLALSAGGVVSGTPTAAGTSTVTVKVTDSTAPTKQAATKSLSVTIAVAALSVTTTSLSGGTVGAAYSQSLAATGGTTPYAWSVVSGALPAGLSLNATSGAITGTPSGSPSTSSFTVRVTDSTSPTKKTADKALSIAVAPAPAVNITTTTLPQGQAGVAYSQTLAASGGTQPYAWSIVLGSIPAGMSLSSGGVLSGTPTAPGTSSFSVKVIAGATDDTQALTLVVKPAPLAITTTGVAAADLNQPYEQDLTATGGVAPYTWTLTSGTLPAGVSLTAAGVLTGTPTAGGTFSFTAQVKDSASPAVTATKSLSLTVRVPPVTITPTTLSDGTVGVEYDEFLFVSGGSSPTCTVSVSAGALPSGLTLVHDTEDGGYWQVTGKPLAAGSSTFTLSANCGGTIGTRSYTLKVLPTPLAMTTETLPPTLVGGDYEYPLDVQGGTGPYTWSIASGAFPTGLTLSSAGTVSGTAPGSFTEGTASVRVTDSTGASVTRSFTIYVNEFELYPQYGNGTVGVAYTSVSPDAFGFEPYTWTAAGALPAGLALGGSTGQITGTPTNAGTFTFAVQATDANGLRAKAPSSVLIYSPGTALTITTTSLPGGQVDHFYAGGLGATGGHPGYYWEATAGTLPPGLHVDGFDCVGPDGPQACWELEGSPEEAGTYTFTLTVTDDGQVKASKAYTVVIAPAPLAITTATLAPGTVGAAYQQALNATGGVAPYTWSLASGTMPAGMTLSASGLIAGTPTATATATLSLKVTDSAATTAIASLSLLVGNPVAASSVSTGLTHSCAVLGGKVRCWGNNGNGELGTGAFDYDRHATPLEVSGLTGVKAVSVGDGFSCAVLTDGRVACWGANYWGQLGDGSTSERDVPVFTGITTAVAVSAGEGHACALLSGGTLSCWGSNSYGEVGTGSATTTPVKVPTAVTGVTGATSVSAGASTTCVVVTGGAAKCWGTNSYGQLGNGTFDDSLTPVTALASGATQVSASNDSTCARLSSGAVSCWGSLAGETPTTVAGVSGASWVAVGSRYACAQTGTTVTCWGDGYVGQLGNGSTADQETPVTVTGVSGTMANTIAAGSATACVVLTAGSVRCWGYNDMGQVGSGLLGSSLVPVAVTGIGAGSTSVALGGSHVCAVVAGAAKCWGDNSMGQSGTGATETAYSTPQAVSGLASGVKQVTGGSWFSCALRTAGTVACWGSDSSGELGDGTYTDTATPVAVAGISDATMIASGQSHTCALRAGGTISCWGADWASQLGGPDLGYDGLPVAVPGLSGVSSVSAGGDTTCAVKGGLVWCWGDNSSGQIGDGTYDQADAPKQVAGLSGVASVSVGTGWACAALTTGGVKCWGTNYDGNLGTGDTVDHLSPTAVVGITNATQVAAGSGSTTCARLSTGAVQCWGAGYDGELGNGLGRSSTLPKTVSGIGNAVEVQVGLTEVCARLSSGALQCWGDGGAGGLGNGGATYYLTPQKVVGT